MATQKPRKTWKTRGKRLARATVAAIVSLYVLYVVAINVFLSTSLFNRVVNFDPITLDIHFSKGWSIFPGTIHAENLSIRSSDSNIEWLLKLDKVEFDMSFLALPQRRFQVDRARGTGIDMRIRQKLMAAPLTIEEIANLPPIPGFPAFSVAPAGPHHPELWDDEQYGLITVRLEDVIAEDVREVWIDDVRFSGHARIDGRFYLKPLRAVDIGPCHVAVSSGQMNVGYARAIATDLGGTFDATADRFDPRAVHDAEALRYFTVATDMHARSAPLDTLPFALPGDVYAAGIVDATTIRVKIDHGHIVDGTRFEASTPRLYLARDGTMGEGAFELHASVEGDQLRAETALNTPRVMRSDAKELLHAARLTMRADSRELDLVTKPFEDLHLGADIDDAVVPDARVANCILPCSVLVHEGTATLNARAEAWPNEKRAAATARLSYANVHASTASFDARATGDVKASFGSFRWDTGVMEGVTVAGDLPETKVTTASSPLRRGELRKGAIGVRIARIDLGDPLAAVDASVAIMEGTHLDVDLFVANKALHGAGDVAGSGHVSIADQELAGFDARVHAPDLRARFGDLYARAGVEGTAASDAGVKQAHVALSRIGLGFSGRGITVDRAQVTVRSSGDALDLEARIAGGRVRDPSALAPILPPSIAIESDHGTFRGDARIAVRGDVKKARVNLATTALGVRTDKVTALGDATVAIDVQRFDGKRLTLGPSRVEVANVRGPLGTVRRIAIDGAATDLDLSDPKLSGVDAHVALEGIDVPDARALQALISPKSKLQILSGALTANGEVAISGANGASGVIAIDAKHAGVAVEKSSIEGDLAFRAKVIGVGESNLDLSGTTLALRNIEVKNAAAETRGWRGDVVLDQTKIGWIDGTPSLGADILLTADDARPVVGMLLRDHAPKLIAGLVTMPNLALRGRFDADPEEVALTDFYVRGGDVGLRGSYAIHDGKKRGAFIVAKSGVAVGVRIGDDGAHPKFFGLADWLRDEEKKVKAPADAAKH